MPVLESPVVSVVGTAMGGLEEARQECKKIGEDMSKARALITLSQRHEQDARRALHFADGRRHLVDEDPHRFQPTYHCDEGG